MTFTSMVQDEINAIDATLPIYSPYLHLVAPAPDPTKLLGVYLVPCIRTN